MRLQAIFRGRQVRKQAAVTLRCMQALVRAQARVRASSVQTSAQDQPVEKSLDKNLKPADPIKQAEVHYNLTYFNLTIMNINTIQIINVDPFVMVIHRVGGVTALEQQHK